MKKYIIVDHQNINKFTEIVNQKLPRDIYAKVVLLFMATVICKQ